MKKLLPFELENNPMTDDPLQFLMNFTGMVLMNKYMKWIECILLITLVFSEFFNVVAIFRYFTGRMESINKYIAFMAVPQTVYVGVVFLIGYLESFIQYMQRMFGQSSELNNAADERFLRKLMTAKKITIIGCVFIYVLVFMNTIIYFPFVGDEQDILYSIKFANECGHFSNLLCVLYYVSLLVSTIGFCYPFFLSTYAVFHFKFQCELLNNYFKVNIVQFTLAVKNCIEDARCQEEIYRRLKICAKKHETSNRFFKPIRPLISAMMLCLSVTADLTLIGSLYFIAAEISPQSNFRIYYTIMSGVFFIVLYCTLGQLINNESDILFNTLCSCPWYDWNVRNRKVLLMMLRDAYLEPFEINFCGMTPLNFSFMLQFLKVTYSILAVAVNFV